MPRESLSRALHAASARGFDIVAGPIPFSFGTPEYRELHRASKTVGQDLLTVDLLVVTAVLEDVYRDAVRYEWRGRLVSVVSRDELVRMKRLAGRPQDLADIDRLIRGEGADDA